jgi:hypothetical protein
MSVERGRLDDPDPNVVAAWREWGPYVSEREWGSVREDYSADGEAWRYLTHDEARSTAYRWGEDGLAGVCDRRQGVCLGLALWNGRDPIVKERLFGLSGKEGNHGEDVKECYWYEDATPTHSWLRWRYHYPQAEFPYADLVAENARRTAADPEYELLDTGVFDQGYWAVEAIYAKASPSDLCLRVRATNHGPARARLHLLPTIWFRNVWSWGRHQDRPVLSGHTHAAGQAMVVDHPRLGRWVAVAIATDAPTTAERLLFCDNDTNVARRYGRTDGDPYPKDGINDHVVSGGAAATVNPDRHGTKASWWFQGDADPEATLEWRVRFARIGDEPAPPPPEPLVEPVDHGPGGSTPGQRAARVARRRILRDRSTVGVTSASTSPNPNTAPPLDAGEAAFAPVLDVARGQVPAPESAQDTATRFGEERYLDEAPITDTDLPDLGGGYERVLAEREAEADELYAELTPAGASDDEAMVLRRALAGLLWSEQFYRFDVARWLEGDPAGPTPPPDRGRIRNGHWRHLDANDVIVMPDKWEYPWFASWDLAFHAVALAHIDPELAKQQLQLLFRVWYQHPNGQLPAYEWEFGDANPPVHAWAALRVFEIDAARTGRPDHDFLERIFHKLLLNFTWWVNREDAEGNNAFEGGFLGLDNIGPFNRSEHLPFDGLLEQSDGTGWMAMYCLNLLQIALVLAARNPVYEDLAVKFFEHFTLVAEAMNETGFWSEQDAFFYDIVRLADGTIVPLKIRSMVGLIPALALTVIHDHDVAGLDTFIDRARWFVTHKPTSSGLFGRYVQDEDREMGLLSVVSPERLGRILQGVFDEGEFLAPHGLRSMSRAHRDQPVVVDLGGVRTEVRYEPAESRSGLFGGNSNWRGPIWMPLNVMAVEKLRHFEDFVGESFTLEYPTGSGTRLNLGAIADDLAGRLIALFLADPTSTPPGRRPVWGDDARLQGDPVWRDRPWFFEYFDGDTGRGLGASHQTGWTALVAHLIIDRARGAV